MKKALAKQALHNSLRRKLKNHRSLSKYKCQWTQRELHPAHQELLLTHQELNQALLEHPHLLHQQLEVNRVRQFQAVTNHVAHPH